MMEALARCPGLGAEGVEIVLAADRVDLSIPRGHSCCRSAADQERTQETGTL
jgi:hypothetical protein